MTPVGSYSCSPLHTHTRTSTRSHTHTHTTSLLSWVSLLLWNATLLSTFLGAHAAPVQTVYLLGPLGSRKFPVSFRFVFSAPRQNKPFQLSHLEQVLYLASSNLQDEVNSTYYRAAMRLTSYQPRSACHSPVLSPAPNKHCHLSRTAPATQSQFTCLSPLRGQDSGSLL